MYVCMHVCMYYACMYLCTLFGVLFGAPGGIDVPQMLYARIMLVCMYRLAGSTGKNKESIDRYAYIYVCIHVCMYYVCMCVRYWARYLARQSLSGIDVSQVEHACIMNVCIYRRAGSAWSTIYVCT